MRCREVAKDMAAQKQGKEERARTPKWKSAVVMDKTGRASEDDGRDGRDGWKEERMMVMLADRAREWSGWASLAAWLGTCDGSFTGT